MMLLAILLSSAPLPLPRGDRGTVTVTGRSLADTRRDLENCLAQQCPPKDEIARSLAYAEAQFLMGDYRGGRKTMLIARRRNARYASELPEDVSDLHYATGRFANLVGNPDSNRLSMFDAVDALKAGLPDTDSRVMQQRLAIGDGFAINGQLYAALSQYGSVARKAHSVGLTSIEGMAQFKAAVLLAAVASSVPEFAIDARRKADAILANDDPAFLPYRNGVRMLRARLVRKSERDAAIAEVIKEMEPMPGMDQALIHNPPIRLDDISFGAVPGDATPWADINFWVTADGRVSDISTVRQSEDMNKAWLKPVVRALETRRYLPNPKSSGVMHMERISFIADLTESPRSRIRTRETKRRVDIVDLLAQPSNKRQESTPALHTPVTPPA